ncbi:tyrosyl-tRNA synthetase [Rhodoligotrophos appendicifer]|uniref:tyrosine--tRNA ligase n=1 Tax=Rhodoligotrophos appendicifer TaxID=987056 RepID=UPI0011852396|nr:tyrosine--tRNA ligase [Rhodoligotrophos appendicifer]
MTELRSDFLNILHERGFVHQCSDLEGLDALCAAGPVTAYVGYDCTGPSLHVGHLLSIMMLRWFQKTGHRPVTLMGGGTTRVGDPSGKDESRRILTLEQIEANKLSLREVFSRFLSYEAAPNAALMTDNAEWLAPLNYIDFLRDVGRHFSVNRMLSFDSVKTRLEREHELSFLEFNYMILQAYDFVELSRRHGVRLQMGGSDQWGNIINGIDLGRRMGTDQLYALTCPLITTASGAKMGKTAQGAMWLKPELLSPYEYWQFWRNSEDGDVGRFLKLFTELSLDDIRRLEALSGQEINEAKKVLATEATALLHGRAAAEQAAETARQAFEEGTAASGLPTIEIGRSELETGIGILAAGVRAGLGASNSELRRAVAGNAIRINDEAVTDDKRLLTSADVNADGVIKLSLGKKKHILLRPTPY